MAAGRPRLASVKAAVARVFGVRPRRSGPGPLLFSYLFLVVGSFIAAKNSRDAMFLSRFSAIELPFVDLPVALLVGLWVCGLHPSRTVRLAPDDVAGQSARLRRNGPRVLVRLAPLSRVVGAAPRLHLDRHVRRRRTRAGLDPGELRADDAGSQAAVWIHWQRCDARGHGRRIVRAADRHVPRRREHAARDGDRALRLGRPRGATVAAAAPGPGDRL